MNDNNQKMLHKFLRYITIYNLAVTDFKTITETREFKFVQKVVKSN